MPRIPCLNSMAADRLYFEPDEGDLYEEFISSLSDADLDAGADELATELHGPDCNDWSNEQWEAFKAEHSDAIADRLWMESA